MKKLTIIFLATLFILFCTYLKLKQAQYTVLQIVSPTEVVIDYNKDKKIEQNEYTTLNLISFSSKSINEELCKNLKLSVEDYVGLAYLAEKFSNEFFATRKIELINKQIYSNGKSYESELLKQGLALKPEEKINKKVLENIKKAKELNLVILNPKNNTYHKIDCKYGLKMSNKQILPIAEVKNAKPCSYCLPKPLPQKENSTNIQNLKPPVLNYCTENIKIFITDFTLQKPNNKCETLACKTLVREINLAKSSIDFAIYGYSDIPAVRKALVAAQKRGVNIRFIFDTNNGENIYPDTFKLSELFRYNNSDVAPAIMHNKFFIFDNQKVFTGSANISSTDMSAFNSNVSILINSKELATAFSKEFENMYLGKFHKQKLLVEKEAIIIDNTQINCFFSPRDNIIKIQILPLISNAHSYIYIPAFLITHYGMTETLIKAKKQGVDVKIILDATNIHKVSSSKIKELRKANIPVKTEIFAGKLHSKSILIDDQYTILGSMNFSKSGEESNDENVLIIYSPEITKFYKKYFLYLWNKIPNKWLKGYARAESIESVGSCYDGIDNDFDGKIDKEDSGCYLKVLQPLKRKK